jgi:hypothetical protein
MTASQKLDPSEMMLRSIHGSTVSHLEQPAEGVWHFAFPAADLNVSCPWRLIDAGAIVLSGSDHRQKFGLPHPVNVCTETVRILNGKTVENACIDEITADPRITLSGGTRIDVFNNSGGYEGWQFGDRNGLNLIAQGGGQIAIWDTGTAPQR